MNSYLFLPPIFHEKEKKLYKTSNSRKGWGFGEEQSVMDQIVLSGLAFAFFSPLVVDHLSSKADGAKPLLLSAETVTELGAYLWHFINGVL